MRSAITHIKQSKAGHRHINGFTLVEMSIAIMLVGLFIAAMAPAYKIYIRGLEDEQTKAAFNEANAALGNYKDLYGRYPCPADPTLVPGDPEYGYERLNCDVLPTPLGLVATNSIRSPALTNDIVVSGILPFRSLNIQEYDIHDGKKNRLTYAVTAALTNATTYADTRGGISIVDASSTAGNNKLSTPDSAHYAIVSHGQNPEGGWSSGGQVIGTCGTAPALDQENCDGDSVFRDGAQSDTFDDITSFSNDIPQQPWQYSAVINDNVHLKGVVVGGANSVALATGNPDPVLTGSPPLDVRNTSVPSAMPPFIADGIIAASETPTDPSTGTFMSENLCDAANGNCFAPTAIGGATLPTPPSTFDGPGGAGGLYCGTGFLVAIENGDPVCADAQFTCPTNEFITGVDASNRIVCGTLPLAACPADTVTTSCGETQARSSAASGISVGVFSGFCHSVASGAGTFTTGEATSIQATNPTAAAFVAAMNAEIATKNGTARAAPTACSLVRDKYTCTAGTFAHIEARERATNSTWPALSTTASGTNIAETGGAAYGISTPVAANTDCWCREDYRLTTAACGTGAGNVYTLQRSVCPRTVADSGRSWTNVWNSGTAYCGCVAGPNGSTSTTCNAHYGVTGLSGNVTQALQRICPSGTNINYCPLGGASCPDTSACTCPANAPMVTTTSCAATVPCVIAGTCPAAAYTSTLSHGGINNLAEVRTVNWVCPQGPAPVTPASIGGYYNTGAPVVTTATCNCTGGFSENRTTSCPNPAETGYMVYSVDFDCATNSYEPPGSWTEIEDNCVGCNWKEGVLQSSFSAVDNGNKIGTSCACGSTGPCYKEISGGYRLYHSCTCSN